MSRGLVFSRATNTECQDTEASNIHHLRYVIYAGEYVFHQTQKPSEGS